MNPFVHTHTACRVAFGRGRVRELAAELAALGIARPMVVCSARVARSAAIASLEQALPTGSVQVFARVEVHAPLAAAGEGASIARAHAADAIVAFGGGSASDLAKGIALAVAEGEGFERFAMKRVGGAIVVEPSTTPKLPLIAIPTTLSGAEVTPGFSLTRADHYKLLFRDPQLAARLLVLDPELIADVPLRVLVGSGMNALAHCFEALYSKGRTPLSDVCAEEALRRLWMGLATRIDGGDGGDDLMIGGWLAGTAIVNARTALHHAICHKLAPIAGLSHGDANALVLPHALAFNLPACPDIAARMADLIGLDTRALAPDAIAQAVAHASATPARRAGLTMQLRATGIERAALATVAERVFGEPGLTFNPRPVASPGEIERLLAGAW